MKVLLVNYRNALPVLDSFLPDAGMAQLSAVIKELGASFSYIDLHIHTINDVYEFIQREQPNIIGFKVWDAGSQLIIKALPQVMSLSPSSTIVIGGPQATEYREEIFALSPHIQYVISGEGEKALGSFAKYVSGQIPLTDVPNLYYKDNNRIEYTHDYYEMNLDNLPLPDYEAIQIKNYFPVVNINFRRGCPHCCTFCNHNYIWGTSRLISRGENTAIRSKSMERIIKETSEAINRYDVSSFSIADSLPKKEFILAWADYLNKENYTCEWTALSKIKQYQDSELKLLMKSGCKSLWIGVESGDDDILSLMNKPHRSSDILEYFNSIESNGIVGVPGFIIGFPGETFESVQNTLKVANDIKCPFAIFSPYLLKRGSHVAEYPKHYGVEVLSDTWRRKMSLMNNQEAYKTHYFNIRGKNNNDYWSTFSDICQDIDFEDDCTCIKSEFTLLLASRLGISNDEFSSVLNYALKDTSLNAMKKLIAAVWDRKPPSLT